MCGIAGVFLRDPSLSVNMDEITSTLLDGIEARGQHATGVLALDSEGVAEWQKAACDATTFNRYRRIIPNSARLVLGHTRWATQGLPAFMENNHPIRRGPFYIIHNGHVSNDDELFVKAGRHRFGEVDSEAIAAHLASLGDLSLLPIVMEAIDGDAAVAAVDERDCTRLAVARGRSSPLWIYNGKKIVIFASTKDAVTKAHAKHVGRLSDKRLFFLKEGIFLEWRDDADYEAKEFKVQERKWTYTGSSTWKPSWSSYGSVYGGSGYSWEGSLDSQLHAIEEKSRTSKPDIDPDEDTLICDNCGHVTFWDDVEYRWVRGESFSFILCQECAEEFDEDEWIDGAIKMWDDEDENEDEVDENGFSVRTFDPDLNDFDPTDIEDAVYTEDVEIIDDYENANESIIRSLARKFMNGGSDAV